MAYRYPVAWLLYTVSWPRELFISVYDLWWCQRHSKGVSPLYWSQMHPQTHWPRTVIPFGGNHLVHLGSAWSTASSALGSLLRFFKDLFWTLNWPGVIAKPPPSQALISVMQAADCITTQPWMVFRGLWVTSSSSPWTIWLDMVTLFLLLLIRDQAILFIACLTDFGIR